jgi:hypothetical protein
LQWGLIEHQKDAEFLCRSQRYKIPLIKIAPE